MRHLVGGDVPLEVLGIGDVRRDRGGILRVTRPFSLPTQKLYPSTGAEIAEVERPLDPICLRVRPDQVAGGPVRDPHVPAREDRTGWQLPRV